MLWAYDEAIVQDLVSCIDPSGGASNTVKMMGDEGMMGVFAQLQADSIKFPALFLQRNAETPLDSSRYNFTRLHKGVPAVYDSEKNNIYMEKAVPIELKYDLHVLTTNTIDMDEMIREILFRYSSMYYITMQVPYESKRQLRFGIAIKPDTTISRHSGASEYIENGRLYESIIELECQGAVLLSYTPRHMQGIVMDQDIKLEPSIETNVATSLIRYRNI